LRSMSVWVCVVIRRAQMFGFVIGKLKSVVSDVAMLHARKREPRDR
jgi:hypothetical protein